MVSARRHRHLDDEEDESAFISMTDMTVSVLFIVLILLAFFASQLRPEGAVPVLEHDAAIAELAKLEAELNQAEALMQELTDGAIDPTTLAKLREDVSRLTAEVEANRELEERLAEQDAKVAQLMDALDRANRRLAVSEANPLQQYNSAVANTRLALLIRLRDQINTELPELGVRLSPSNDALQFQGDGLFSSGSAALSAISGSKVRRIAEIIHAALPCFSLGSRSNHDAACNPDFAIIEALQIEGHADSVGSFATNARLSSQRAANTFIEMVSHQPDLSLHTNLSAQPVLSVAGYGEDRPITDNETLAGRASNRRIDLRFIMLRPARVEDIEGIERALLSGALE